MNVLYVFSGAGNPVRDNERRLVESLNRTEPRMHIDLWDWTSEMGLPSNPSLPWARDHRAELEPFYAKLFQRARLADVVLISQTGGILPEVMAEIPRGTVVYVTADDPDSSATCSFPFLQSADVIAHVGVNFNARQRIGDVFLERGAKRCIHFPIGFYEEMFPPIPNVEEQLALRPYDLVYLGHVKRGKLENIMRAFPRMIVHSRTLRLKHRLYLLAHTGRWITPFMGDVAELYRNCKIGINMHFTYGPSNARCYQLAACGVAQVMDCPEGVGAIFEPGKEVLSYASPDEAIAQIRLLEGNQTLCRTIALNGYRKAWSCYNRKTLFVNFLKSL